MKKLQSKESVASMASEAEPQSVFYRKRSVSKMEVSVADSPDGLKEKYGGGAGGKEGTS